MGTKIDTEPDARAGTDRTTELPFGPGAARAARIEVALLLGEECRAAIAEAAQLLTSELATNAVLHGAPPAGLRVVITPTTIRVEIHDGSALLPVPRDAALDDPDGRGLAILQALASRWGAEPTPLGKLVWFELPNR